MQEAEGAFPGGLDPLAARDADPFARPIDLGALAPMLAKTCAEYVAIHRNPTGTVQNGAPSDVNDAATHFSETASKYAKALDGLVGALYCAAEANVRARLGPARSIRTSVLAVGAYGTGVLGVHEPVQLRFVADDADAFVSHRGAAVIADACAETLRSAGLSVSASVDVAGTQAAYGDDEELRLLACHRRVAGDRSLADSASLRIVDAMRMRPGALVHRLPVASGQSNGLPMHDRAVLDAALSDLFAVEALDRFFPSPERSDADRSEFARSRASLFAIRYAVDLERDASFERVALRIGLTHDKLIAELGRHATSMRAILLRAAR